MQDDGSQMDLESEKSEFLKDFSLSPGFAFTVSGLAILFILTTVGWLIFSTSKDHENSIVELREIFSQSRPIEARIEGFKHTDQVVGRNDDDDERAIRFEKIENSLVLEVSSAPSAKSHNALGVFYLTQKRFAQSIAQFDKAETYLPDGAQSSANRAIAYFGKAAVSSGVEAENNLAEALVQIDRAIKGGDKSLATFFNRALILEKLKQYTKAQAAWRAYLEKDGVSKWAEEAQDRLEKLR